MFAEPARPPASTTPTLDQVGIDLTAQAREGKLAPVVGRDKDLERVIQVLSRLPFPRTGIRKNNVALISDFIDEPHALVAFAQRAYGAAAGRVDVDPLLVPALARGEIQCIGATTLDEYRRYIERDAALQHHFQEVIVHTMIAPDETVLDQRADNDSPQEQG